MFEVDNQYTNVLLFFGFLALFVYIFRQLQYAPEEPYEFHHPFDQWWRRKDTSISPWYQDHFFDSKRRDNLFPTYQTI
jgi:hypothetical protein